jgi:hypothetical protein
MPIMGEDSWIRELKERVPVEKHFSPENLWLRF